MVSSNTAKSKEFVQGEDILTNTSYIEDTASSFLNEIGKYPLLSKEEIEECVNLRDRGIKDGVDRLVLHNMRLVVSYVKSYSRMYPNIGFMDLVQEGSMGLMTAAERYDLSKGAAFSTYAVQWIKQGISRYIANNASNIRCPVHVRTLMGKIRKFTSEYISEYGHTPTESEIADGIGESSTSVKRALSYMRTSENTVSLETPIGESEDATFYDIIPCEGKSLFDIVANKGMSDDINDILIKALKESEYNVVTMRWGINDGVFRTLEECGKILGVTRERVRQIEAKAFRVLRSPRYSSILKSYLA